jgi:hypothetical protein
MTIQTAMLELQTKMFERLSSDPTLLAKIEGVFDAVEEDQLHPYITIGEPTMLPFTTKSKFGEELAIVIHSWSVYAGKKESYEILNLCLASLRVQLGLNGFTIRKVVVENITVIDDVDPRIKHGILRLKYTIQNN